LKFPADSKVIISLYNVLGQEISNIVNEFMEAGYHTAEFNGSNLASGVYFYRITAGNFTDIKKMVLVK
jgi:hypothetical protein